MSKDEIFARVRALCGKLTEQQWVAILLVRLSVGLVFFDSGRGKLGRLEKMTEFFATLGIPFPAFNAVLASATECFGGLLIMLGLGTRLWAAQLAFVMLVAIKTAAIHEEKVDTFLKFLYLHEWGFFLVFVWLVFSGSGKASLDHLIARRFAPEKADAKR